MELKRYELLVYFKQDFQPEIFRNVLRFCLKRTV